MSKKQEKIGDIIYVKDGKVDSKNEGKLVLVTAINPTAAGNGKTTVSIGLAVALSKLGKKTTDAPHQYIDDSDED